LNEDNVGLSVIMTVEPVGVGHWDDQSWSVSSCN